jgi:hypothetical protein
MKRFLYFGLRARLLILVFVSLIPPFVLITAIKTINFADRAWFKDVLKTRVDNAPAKNLQRAGRNKT